MKLFQTLDIHKKIQLTAFALLVAIYTTSGIFLVAFTVSRALVQTNQLMSQVLTDLSQLTTTVTDLSKSSTLDTEQKQAIKKAFEQPQYFENTYPFMVDDKGYITVDIFREGQKIRKDIFEQLQSNKNKEGYFKFNEEEAGVSTTKLMYFKYYQPYNSYICIVVNKNVVLEQLASNQIWMLLIVILSVIIFFFGLRAILKPLSIDIFKLSSTTTTFAKGELPAEIQTNRKDDLGQLIGSMNKLIGNITKTAQFASEIGNNNLDAEYTPVSENDVLGTALIEMRESLIKAQKEEKIRKAEEEKQRWVTTGLAMFGEILRQNNNDLTLLSENVIQNLVNYLNANQGGIFALSEDSSEEQTLDLVASFAYNRKKYLTKKIMVGEGLVGTCAIEKKTIHLKEIPEGYITITSGLGEATPSNLLIVPLKLEDSVFGVLEIASLTDFMPHEIEFVEKLSESIASTLSSVRINLRTTYLLEQSQQQREEMAAQEEEMRQNMEEMQATQEEMQRKTAELESVNTAINEALLQGEMETDGVIINLNQNLVNVLGLIRDEILGSSLFELAPNQTARELKELWKRVAAGESEKGVFLFKNAEEKEVYLMLSFSPAFDEVGSFVKVLVLGQDVTETKLLEQQAMHQAEEIEKNIEQIKVEQEIAKARQKEIDAMLHALNQNVIVSEMTSDGKITFINQKNVDILGDAPEKIIGRVHRELDGTAKSNPKAYNAFWDALMNGIPQERVFSLKVGAETKWVREHYNPIPDEKGEIYKIITLGFDITAEKLFELEAEKLKGELKNKKR